MLDERASGAIGGAFWPGERPVRDASEGRAVVELDVVTIGLEPS